MVLPTPEQKRTSQKVFQKCGVTRPSSVGKSRYTTSITVPPSLGERVTSPELAIAVSRSPKDEPSDLIDQSAVLAEGLVGSHAWVDGNKRTIWVDLRTFLEVNGLVWLAPPEVDDAVKQMTGLTTRRVDAGAFAVWLRARLREGR